MPVVVARSDLESEHVWLSGEVYAHANPNLIADDDATIRLLLRRLLEKLADWQVCGEASNGVEAIEGVEQFEPDIVVMDLAMPVMNGLQAVRLHPLAGHPGSAGRQMTLRKPRHLSGKTGPKAGRSRAATS